MLGNIGRYEPRAPPSIWVSTLISVARACCAQQYSAVAAACMLRWAEAFRDVEGFDEIDLAITFNDVDLCLWLGARGWRLIWTPISVAEHYESLRRVDDMPLEKAARFFHENQIVQGRHAEELKRDPFYNSMFFRLEGTFTDLQEIGQETLMMLFRHSRKFGKLHEQV